MLKRWALSPRTPAAVARRVTELAVLTPAAGFVALAASGLLSHWAATVVVSAGQLLGTVA